MMDRWLGQAFARDTIFEHKFAKYSLVNEQKRVDKVRIRYRLYNRECPRTAFRIFDALVLSQQYQEVSVSIIWMFSTTFTL